jgi:hypothetical protein
VCGVQWDNHPLWTLLDCVKVLERRSDFRAVGVNVVESQADNRQTTTPYFMPQLTKRQQEDRFRQALEYRRKCQA